MDDYIKKIIKPIFEYDNYREFLKDYFINMKKIKNNFTFRYFAHKAGFRSPSFCSHVIKGKRNLSLDSIKKLGKAVDLDYNEQKFFEYLVMYNQSNNLEEREEYYSKLNAIRTQQYIYQLGNQHLLLYHSPLYSIIRDLVVYSNWNGDYKKLASYIEYDCNVATIKKIVKDLLDMGLIIYENNKYFYKNSVISSGQVPSFLVNNLKIEFLKLAIDGVTRFNSNEKFITTSTITLSEKSFKESVKILEEARKKIFALAVNESNVEKSYQLNIAFVPNTKKLGIKWSKE